MSAPIIFFSSNWPNLRSSRSWYKSPGSPQKTDQHWKKTLKSIPICWIFFQNTYDLVWFGIWWISIFLTLFIAQRHPKATYLLEFGNGGSRSWWLCSLKRTMAAYRHEICEPYTVIFELWLCPEDPKCISPWQVSPTKRIPVWFETRCSEVEA